MEDQRTLETQNWREKKKGGAENASRIDKRIIDKNRKSLEAGEEKAGPLIYPSKGKFAFFLLPSPPNTRISPGEMAGMKFKWNQATFCVISKINNYFRREQRMRPQFAVGQQ